MAQYRDEIADLNVTDEERVAMLTDYWNQLMDTYGVLADKALADGAWITNTYDVYDHQLIDGWEETVTAGITGINTMEDFMSGFNEAAANLVANLTGDDDSLFKT